MTKETILKRLLLENHITLDELVILMDAKQREKLQGVKEEVKKQRKSTMDILQELIDKVDVKERDPYRPYYMYYDFGPGCSKL